MRVATWRNLFPFYKKTAFWLNGMEKEILKIEDAITQNGIYVGPTVGMSMYPMLKNRRDTIIVRPKTERLKRLEVALYKRGESYIMHRVIEVLKDGYLIRGDNCYYDEIVAEEDVIGILTEFYRKDKHYLCTDTKYIRYAKKRVKRYKIRLFFYKVKRKIRRILKRK